MRLTDRPRAALTRLLAVMLLAALLIAPLASARAQSGGDAGSGADVETQAASQQGIRIAVIDMQKIMSDSKAVQSIQRQIDRQREQYQSDLQRRERELREANEALASERNVLSQDAFRQKRRRLEEQVTELQREIQRSKRRLDRNYSQAMRQVQDQLVQIVRDLATRQDIDMVLGKATVVIVRPRLDLTDRALKRLNAELSSVDVPPLKQ
jgi:Skp family chaperone for outer membrane proteins